MRARSAGKEVGMRRWWLTVAALCGAASLILGAVGRHGINYVEGGRDNWLYAERYLQFHTLALTSPPYMPRSAHPEDPLAAYRVEGAGYDAYLRGLGAIYRQIKTLLLPEASVVLEVSNLKNAGDVTPLAWDVATTLADLFHFEGEVIVAWDEPSFGFDHTYCLVFKNTV
jgi:hypothetical protein